MKDSEIFRFERGAFFSGELMYSIEKIGDKYILKGHAYNGFNWMQDVDFVLPEDEIEKLGKIIEPVQEWNKKYEGDEMVLDGYGWEICFSYKGKMIQSSGYEEYPENYRKVVGKLQRFIECMGKKYNPNYQQEGRRERINL